MLKVSLVNVVSPVYAAKRQSPFAVQVLAGYLRGRNVPAAVQVVDMQSQLDTLHGTANLDRRFDEAVRQTLLQINDSQIIGLSMKWGSLDIARRIVQGLPRGDTGPLIVLGNTLATFGSGSLLAQADFSSTCLVEGEGEKPLEEIIVRASQSSGGYQNPGNYLGIENLRISPSQDINRVPLNLRDYPEFTLATAAELFGKKDNFPLEFSRGCPWGACTFCSVGDLYGSPVWRSFPVERGLNLMKRRILDSPGELRRATSRFHIVDSELFGSMKRAHFDESIDRVRQIAEGIIHLREKLGREIVVTSFSARVDTIFKDGEDDNNRVRLETSRLLQRAGFRKVYLGLESGSPSKLKKLGKGITISESEAALKILETIGFSFEVGFIFFTPDATREELQKDIDFIERNRLYENNSRLLGSLRAQAGSPIARRLQEKGLVSQELDLNLASFPIIRYADEEVGQLEELFESWEAQTKELVQYLNSFISIKQSFQTVKNPWLAALRKIDFDFAKELLSTESGQRRVLTRRFASALSELLQQIQRALLSGELVDSQNRLKTEILPQARTNNQRFLEKNNG